MSRLTVVIATRNEESRIGELLEQVKWADEIVIVDMFSTDRTLQIARQYTDKVFQYDSFRETGSLVPEPIAVNKNRGFERATGDWLLELDADERPSPELINEIKAVLAQEQVPYDGYVIPYRVYFFGHHIRYGGWQNDRHIRFFRRGAACWETRRVHLPHKFNGRLASFKAHIDHYTCDDIEQLVQKINWYSSQDAEAHFREGRRVKLHQLVVRAPRQFLKRFVALQGYRDGVPGFIVAALHAFGSFLLEAKLWQLWKRAERNESAP